MTRPRSKRLLLGPGHVGGGRPPRGGCPFKLLLLPILAPILLLLQLARHRATSDGEPLGHLGRKLADGPGDWHPPRDDTPAPPWPGGKRPPLRDNTTPNGVKP